MGGLQSHGGICAALRALVFGALLLMPGAYLPHEDARGNVGFADGHVDFFSRKDALRAKYSGNPTPDPVGF